MHDPKLMFSIGWPVGLGKTVAVPRGVLFVTSLDPQWQVHFWLAPLAQLPKLKDWPMYQRINPGTLSVLRHQWVAFGFEVFGYAQPCAHGQQIHARLKPLLDALDAMGEVQPAVLEAVGENWFLDMSFSPDGTVGQAIARQLQGPSVRLPLGACAAMEEHISQVMEDAVACRWPKGWELRWTRLDDQASGLPQWRHQNGTLARRNGQPGIKVSMKYDSCAYALDHTDKDRMEAQATTLAQIHWQECGAAAARTQGQHGAPAIAEAAQRGVIWLPPLDDE